jgi:hypothetical protein
MCQCPTLAGMGSAEGGVVADEWMISLRLPQHARPLAVERVRAQVRRELLGLCQALTGDDVTVTLEAVVRGTDP